MTAQKQQTENLIEHLRKVIPQEMQELKQFVCWSGRWATNKKGETVRDKTPRTPQGRLASNTDPKTWSTFEEALEGLRICEGLNGIGYVFTRKSRVKGVDLDHIINDERFVIPEFQRIVEGFNSYTEKSLSGDGVHIFCLGEGDFENFKSKFENYGRKISVELFSHSCYIALTGNLLANSGGELKDGTEQLKTLGETYNKKASKGKPKKVKTIEDTGNFSESTIKTTIAALKKCNYNFDNREEWLKLCFALRSVDLNYSDVKKIFNKSQNHDPEKDEKTYYGCNPTGISFSTAVYFARKYALEEFERLQEEDLKKMRKKLTSKKSLKKLPKPKKVKKKTKRILAPQIENYLKLNAPVQENEFSGQIFLNGKKLFDGDLKRIEINIHTYFNGGLTFQLIEKVICVHSWENRYNPLEDWYNSLPDWDGTDHIKRLAEFLPGSKTTERKLKIYFGECIGKWVYNLQAMVLVLIGNQGIGKSLLAEAICPIPEYFVESHLDPLQKDHQLMAARNLIWEMGELGATTRKADQEALKAHLTRKNFTLRSPYGKREREYPHRACYIGTVNKEGGFLYDKTGSRRYHCVTLNSINWDYSKEIDFDQLWGQAKEIFKAGAHKMNQEDRKIQVADNEQETVIDPLDLFLESQYEITGRGEDFVTSEEIHRYLGSCNFRDTSGLSRRIKIYLSKFSEVLRKKKKVKGKSLWCYTGIKTYE